MMDNLIKSEIEVKTIEDFTIALGFDNLDIIRNDNNGQYYFYAKQIADGLGLSNPTSMIKSADIDNEDKDYLMKQTKAGMRRAVIINIYAVQECVMNCRNKSAKRFKKWIIKDVVRNILEKGFYDSLMASHFTEFGKGMTRAITSKNTNKELMMEKEEDKEKTKKNMEFSQDRLRRGDLTTEESSKLLDNYRSV